MSDKMTYLCGGINGLSDAECNDWRAYAKVALGTGVYDPMVRDYRGRENTALSEDLVPRDLSDIRKSDFLLVNASKPSWGTAMELVYARMYGIPAIGFCNGNVDKASPWLRHHCELHERIDQAIAVINARAERH